MTSLWLEADDTSLSNPLDTAEQLCLERDWAFDRPHPQELFADCNGNWCNYRLALEWNEGFGSLTLSCAMETRLPPRMAEKVYPLLSKINSRLWLGHFELPEEHPYLTFRYTLLSRNATVTLEQLEDVLDIILSECERFYPAFQSMLWGDRSADDVLKLTLLEAQGQA